MPKLILADTEFELSVEKYEIEKGYDWSDIRLSVKNNYINYSVSNEILQQEEVDEIIEKLEDLIYDRITEKEKLSFIEPDITMKLYPAHINVSDRTCFYKGGHCTSDCFLDITLHFKDFQGIYVDEEWTITLDRDEISALLNGLKSECGKSEGLREYIGLVGVSFIGNWTDIHWYRYDGDKLWSQMFVKVEHDGIEEYGMVEYVRKYDTAHLPCGIDEMRDVIEIASGAKRNELAEKWEKIGYMDDNKHALRMVLSDGTIFTIEKKTASLYRIAVRNEYINYEKSAELFTDEDRQDIADYLAMLLYGDMREVTAVRTINSDLSFMFCPRGAKIVDEWCMFINPTDFHGNRIDKRFAENTMKIDIDLCGDGIYGGRYFSMYLNATEAEQFATQWVVKVCER